MEEPDEGRLLTDEECRLVELRMGESLNWCQPILKAQRNLTASIIRAECQERVERIKREIESIVNKGQSETYGGLLICPVEWQAFWEKEEK